MFRPLWLIAAYIKPPPGQSLPPRWTIKVVTGNFDALGPAAVLAGEEQGVIALLTFHWSLHGGLKVIGRRVLDHALFHCLTMGDFPNKDKLSPLLDSHIEDNIFECCADFAASHPSEPIKE